MTLEFGIALEKVIRNSNVESSGAIYRKASQTLGYADDRVLVELRKVGENFERKTKYVLTSSSSTDRSPTQMLEVGEKHSEAVEKFAYLGSLFRTDNNIGEEIQRRITRGSQILRSLRRKTWQQLA